MKIQREKKRHSYLIHDTVYATHSRGFSLIELMVSVALFSVVMLICVGALLSLVGANRKARALESVMNNLNITLDGMVRSIRMGGEYNCGSTSIPDENTGGDCTIGGSSFSFAPFSADPDVQGERWVYSFVGGKIYRSQIGGGNAYAVTAPEVVIEDMDFYVTGSKRRDVDQPKVVMVVKGVAGSARVKTTTTFYIQATAVQRVLDL